MVCENPGVSCIHSICGGLASSFHNSRITLREAQSGLSQPGDLRCWVSHVDTLKCASWPHRVSVPDSLLSARAV